MSAFATRPVVVVTGGARGIGLATARVLHQRGAQIAIGDLDDEDTKAVAATIGADVYGSSLDVRHPESWASFAEGVRNELGPVSVLVNNAGIMPLGPMLDETPEMAVRIMAVNYHGVLNGMKAFMPEMLARRSGHIINVASVAGLAPTVGGATYGASKAAALSLTETARVEFAGHGLHFTAVNPSFTDTELVAGTRGTRFVATVSPEAVGTAIADVIEHPRAAVFVPKSIGAMMRAQSLLGRRIRDGMTRAIGGHRTFVEIDATQRAAYLERIERQAAEPPRLEAPVD